ncbi:MAG: hypothetical protein FWC23_07175 [Chitinispirillia bacterium]|nr:hypothetical protein [Chitinispirillia bacterium]MCL2268950.1 hypothetical protein [Chitinispirillia bacterium]
MATDIADLQDIVGKIGISQVALTDKISSLADEVRLWVGRFGNNMGYLIEIILVPGIRQKMNELGHNFNRLSARQQYFRKNGTPLVEVDLLLGNGDEAMAVEVKTELSTTSVQDHVRRLEKLRKNESETDLAGKTLYSAVAGLHIDEDARKMALGLGMYVVEMYEDKKFISVVKPEVELGKW